MAPAELQAARKAIGWSRQQLGERTGRSATVIAQMEQAPGQRPVSVDPALAAYVGKVLRAINRVKRPAVWPGRRHAAA